MRELVHSMTESFGLYEQQHEYKRVLLRYIGAAVSVLDAKALIAASLDIMIQKTRRVRSSRSRVGSCELSS